MASPIFLGLFLAVLGADKAPDPSPSFADKVRGVTDAVLVSHDEPPTRQQMVLAGLKSVYRAHKSEPPRELAKIVSLLASPDELAAYAAAELSKSKAGLSTKLAEDAFFDGLLASVPGGGFLVSARDETVNRSFEANLYVGIQVALGLDDKTNRPIFHNILAGGPAEHAGIKANDLIDEVDGVTTEGRPLKDVIDRLRGEEGTTVVVKTRRPKTNEVKVSTLTRSRLPRQTVCGLNAKSASASDFLLEGAGPVALIRLDEIVGSTPAELRRAASKLEDAGAKAVILDLRGVGSSHPHPAVLVADAFLESGTIGRVRHIDKVTTYEAEPDALFRGWPVAVLVGPNTAGAAEWLAAALQDGHRAKLFGAPTAGRGQLMTAEPILGGAWLVQLMTSRLERADGRPIGRQSDRVPVRSDRDETRRSGTGEGVEPDVPVVPAQWAHPISVQPGAKVSVSNEPMVGQILDGQAIDLARKHLLKLLRSSGATGEAAGVGQ